MKSKGHEALTAYGLAAAMSVRSNTYFTPFSEGSGCRSGKTQLTKKQKKARAKTKAQRKARRMKG